MLVLQSVNEYNLFICGTNDAGRRLDRVVKKLLPDVPSGLIYSGIRKGFIKVNGKKSIQSYLVMEKDEIAVKKSISFNEKNHRPTLKKNVDAKISRLTVLKSDNLLLLNKPAGMLTHGKASLAELVDHGIDGISPSLSFKPAPLHRLDRNTSGLIAVSRTIKGASQFTGLMRERKLAKYYLGICLNGPNEKTELENALVRKGMKTGIAGNRADEKLKKARTIVYPVIIKGGYTLCLFSIETGVTHQIRAQLSSAGFPLAGDNKYGGKTKGFRTFYLHSYVVSLPDYDAICGFKSCTADIPDAFRKKSEDLFGVEEFVNALSELKIKFSF